MTLERTVSREKSRGGYFRVLGRDIRRDRWLYCMLVPTLLYFVIFVYRPIWGLKIAFQDYNVFLGADGSPWVGFKHFHNFFTGPYFWRLLRDTVALSLYGLVIGFPIPIILALLFNEMRCKALQKTAQTATYIPHFVSAVVVAGLVTDFLSPGSGIINNIVEAFGGERKYFLMEPRYFRWIYTLMNVWKGAGFSSIIYLAALTAADESLYEAAVLDGANRWKQVWHVSLPAILPTIVTMLIINVGNLLNVGYEVVILLYQPATYETSDIINTYVYRTGLLDGQYSPAAAIGMFNGVVGFVLVCLANKLSKRITEYSLW